MRPIAPPEVQMLKPVEIAGYLRIARTQVHKIAEGDPTFPRPVRVGPSGIRFRRDEFEAWLDGRGEWPEQAA